MKYNSGTDRPIDTSHISLLFIKQTEKAYYQLITHHPSTPTPHLTPMGLLPDT